MKGTSWALAGLLVAFAALCAFRLNSFCLLEPDSPGYLIQASSLASFDGYREIDHPDRPLQTFRPPGFSLLLVPLAWLAPFSVVAAKIFVVGTALAAIVLCLIFASRDGPPWGAIAAAIMIATSPYALLHATEVVTEFPYVTASFAVLLLVTRRQTTPSRREVATLALLLTLLPLLRTIGVALVAAVALWCLADRARRAWLPAPAVAAVVTALWMARNHYASGPTYFGAIGASLARSGVAGFVSASIEAVGFYASRFRDVLFPGVWPGRPLYERMTLAGTPDLAGLHGAAWALALGVVGLAIVGCRARWKRDGALVAMYGLLFFAALAIYPPRHERLAWPLVPLVWALVPAGASAAWSRGSTYGALAKVSAAASMAAVAGLFVWQLSASVAMARDNLAWRNGDDDFYSERIPPLYFVDWQGAGRWLHDHAPANARVLTRHSDVFFTSGLTQDAARFEELAPVAWRARIAKVGVRYLAVPTSLFGKFFPLELLGSDPAYTYSIRWRGGDAAIIEVGPNRTGRVIAAPPPPDALLEACNAAAEREPGRVDLATRCAELLSAAGRTEDAISRLRAIVARGGADVRIQVALGQMLLDARRDEEAAAVFRTAARLPEADLLQQTIERGQRMADELAAAKSLDKVVRARTATVRARAQMDALRWGEAYALVGEALAFAPDDPPVLVTAGDLATRLGAYDTAIGFYGQAGRLGESAASAKGAALRAALAAEASMGSADVAAIASAAAFWAGDGAPGRALDILERAARLHPGDGTIASRLADVRRFYGLD